MSDKEVKQLDLSFLKGSGANNILEELASRIRYATVNLPQGSIYVTAGTYEPGQRVVGKEINERTKLEATESSYITIFKEAIKVDSKYKILNICGDDQSYTYRFDCMYKTRDSYNGIEKVKEGYIQVDMICVSEITHPSSEYIGIAPNFTIQYLDLN